MLYFQGFIFLHSKVLKMSEIQKRKKGQILNNNERQLILNLMYYLKEKNSNRSISEVIREISKATGCSERTIYKIRKEASKGVIVSSNRTRLRKKENKNSRNVKYDSYVKSAIRKKIHNYFLQNIPPTLNAVLCLVNNDPDLPNFKRSTLHTLLKEIGFVYEQKGKKSLLTERNELVKSRLEYLRDIRRFKSENRWIVYTGETVISLMKKEIKEEKPDNSGSTLKEIPEICRTAIPCDTINTVVINNQDMIPSTTLVYTIDPCGLTNLGSEPLTLNANIGTTLSTMECTTDNIPIHTIIADNSYLLTEPNRFKEQEQQTEQVPDDPVTENDSSQSKSASARELRFNILHAGSDSGFLQGTEHIMLCKKKTEESDSYEEWFIEKLLPKIPPNSVVVIDNNAPYHKKKEENIPDNTWKKQQIKNWLASKNIQLNDVTQKKDLLAVVNDVRSTYSTKHKIDEVARQRGIILISLPPYHYELNPLNLIWGQIKCYVKENMKSFKIKKIKQLIREAFYTVTPVNWMNYIHHVRQMEDLLWTNDEMQATNHNCNSSSSQNVSNLINESYLVKKNNNLQ